MAQNFSAGQPGGWQQAPVLERRRSQAACLSCLHFANIAVVVVALFLYLVHFDQVEMELGVHESRLLTANSWFTKSISVSARQRGGWPLSDPTLFTLRRPPPLSRVAKWHEEHNRVSVQGYGYESWSFWFNKGSTMSVKYGIQRGTALYAVVLSGEDNMQTWKSDPLGFAGFEYRRYASGQGGFTFTAPRTGLYYLAFGNVHNQAILVNVFLDVQSRMYDFSDSLARCEVTPSGRPCVARLTGWRTCAVLMAPTAYANDEVWPVSISHTPRLLTHLYLIGIVWLITFVFRVRLQMAENRPEEPAPGSLPHQEQAPGAPESGPEAQSRQPGWRDHVRATLSSWTHPGATSAPLPPPHPPTEQQSTSHTPAPNPYPPTDTSGSPGEEQPWEPPSKPAPSPLGGGGGGGGDHPAPTAPPAEPVEFAEEHYISRDGDEGPGYAFADKGKSAVPEKDLCSICMDAKRDAILLDCGHRATCYSCGLRLLQTGSPSCPICRRSIRRVVKIYDA